MDGYRTLLARKRAVEGDLLRLPGVHAVALGGQLVDGRPTGSVAIQVYVVQKRPERDVEPAQRIPSRINGIPTDVVETPIPRRTAATKQYDPVRGGTAIHAPNAVNDGEGTVGCFAHTLGENVVVGLTNEHVVGPGKGGKVAHPAMLTCGDCCSTEIGEVLDARNTLHVWEAGLPRPAPSGEVQPDCVTENDPPPPEYKNTELQVDAAIFRLNPGVCWSADIEGIGPIAGTHELTFAEVKSHTYPVRKRGRTSGLTSGSASGIHCSGRHTPEGPNEVEQPYVDQLMFGLVADGGDSGSVVVNDKGEVVALLWGSGSQSSVGSPIGAVTEMLGIEIETAEEPGIVNRVPGGTTAPGKAGCPEPVATAGGAQFSALPTQVPSGSLAQVPLLARAGGDGGRWLRSAEEVRQLIGANRRVAAVWRNNHGPIVARCLLFDQPMPAEVGGRAFASCVERILHVLARYGSAALRDDVVDLRRALASEG